MEERKKRKERKMQVVYNKLKRDEKYMLERNHRPDNSMDVYVMNRSQAGVPEACNPLTVGGFTHLLTTQYRHLSLFRDLSLEDLLIFLLRGQ